MRNDARLHSICFDQTVNLDEMALLECGPAWKLSRQCIQGYGERTAITTPLQHRETNPRKPRDVDLPNEPKHCIPLLDDNDDIRFLLRTMLERDYIVGDFDNAADLLEFLEQKPCDLIVSDLRLPDMDGFDFVSALRAKEHWPRVLLLIS